MPKLSYAQIARRAREQATEQHSTNSETTAASSTDTASCQVNGDDDHSKDDGNDLSSGGDKETWSKATRPAHRNSRFNNSRRPHYNGPDSRQYNGPDSRNHPRPLSDVSTVASSRR